MYNNAPAIEDTEIYLRWIRKDVRSATSDIQMHLNVWINKIKVIFILMFHQAKTKKRTIGSSVHKCKFSPLCK